MFRRKKNVPQQTAPQPTERITSVVADGISLRGKLNGAGGVRIEGAYDGDIELDGLLVIGPTGRVTCPQLKARHVIIAGALRGDILAEKVEIRAGGRVWGNVTTVAMATEEGAFLRGQIQMEEKIHLGITRPVTEITPVIEVAAETPNVETAEIAENDGNKEVKTQSQPKPESSEKGKFKRKEKGKAKT
jgi:cytoskeletal protein CcmA (bactofilin family)